MPPLDDDNLILIKRNNVSGVIPKLSSLQFGELSLNTADGKIFIKTLLNSVTAIKTFLNSDDYPYTLNKFLSSVVINNGNNSVSEIFSCVLGGYNNNISGGGSTVANGEDNDISSEFSFVGSGLNNKINADYGGILCGKNNTLNHEQSFIIGSDITSHSTGFTYVNNLSSLGKIYGDGSELTGIINDDISSTSLVKNNSSDWNLAYNISNAYSVISSTFLTVETDSQILSFDEETKKLYISNGNYVSLSGIDTHIKSLTANWENVYSIVQYNSSTNWNNSLVTIYTHSNFLPLSGANMTGSIIGDLSATGSFYGDGSKLTGITAGDIEATTLVRQQSASWGTGGIPQNLLFDELTKELSLTFGNTLSLSSLTSDIKNNYLPLSGGQLTGTIIGDLSATGSFYGDGSKLTGITAGDIEATTLVRSYSANWQTTFLASSGYVSSNPQGITGASALTKLLQITQAGYNSITPDSDTLYIIVG